MQEGQVIKRGSSWALRYWSRVEGGEWVRKYKTICKIGGDYRIESQVKKHPEVIGLLRPKDISDPGVLTFNEYVENHYLPDIKLKKRPSTYKGYKNVHSGTIKRLANGTPLIDFGKPEVSQQLLDKLVASRPLTTRTLIHAKAFVSGVISHALRYGNMPGFVHNPMHNKLVVIAGGRASEPTYSHNLYEVEDILEAVSANPLLQTLVTVAAFTGLRRSEIRGLQWRDIGFDAKFNCSTLTVERTFWEKSSGETKTEASMATIPLIRQAVEQLDAYRKLRQGLDRPDAFIFEGPRPNIPYDLSALGNKRIKPILDREGLTDTKGKSLWHGFHAFRRCVGDTLTELGVVMTTSADVLRHGTSVSTAVVTEQYYTKQSMALMTAAMQKFSDEVDRVRKERQ